MSFKIVYRINCNSQIHDELKNMMESTCPFCDQQLVEVVKTVEPCCTEQDMETVNGMSTCMNCGLVHGCDYVKEYFDFYDNMYRIRHKSVYHQKYRIENVLYSISSKNNIQLPLTEKSGRLSASLSRGVWMTRLGRQTMKQNQSTWRWLYEQAYNQKICPSQ